MKNTGVVKRYLYEQKKSHSTELINLINIIKKRLDSVSHNEQINIIQYLYLNTDSVYNKMLLFVNIDCYRPDFKSINADLEKISKPSHLLQYHDLISQYLDLTGTELFLNPFILFDANFVLFKNKQIHEKLKFKPISYVHLHSLDTSILEICINLDLLNESSFNFCSIHKKLTFLNSLKDIDHSVFSKLINKIDIPNTYKENFIVNHMTYKLLGLPQILYIKCNSKDIDLESSSISFE